MLRTWNEVGTSQSEIWVVFFLNQSAAACYYDFPFVIQRWLSFVMLSGRIITILPRALWCFEHFKHDQTVFEECFKQLSAVVWNFQRRIVHWVVEIEKRVKCTFCVCFICNAWFACNSSIIICLTMYWTHLKTFKYLFLHIVLKSNRVAWIWNILSIWSKVSQHKRTMYSQHVCKMKKKKHSAKN